MILFDYNKTITLRLTGSLVLTVATLSSLEKNIILHFCLWLLFCWWFLGFLELLQLLLATILFLLTP